MPEVELTVRYVPPSGREKAGATVICLGDQEFLSKGDLLRDSTRETILAGCRKRWPGLLDNGLVELLRAELDRAAKMELDRQTREREAPGDEAASEPTPAELLAGMDPGVVAEAEAMLDALDLIERVANDAESLGVVGERALTLLIYLVGVSRLLAQPLAIIVQGLSSSGKSFVIDQVVRLFPPETVILATQMTPQALFHMAFGALSHRFVVAGERSRLENDETAEVTRPLREMLSSGRLSKLMPTKEGGKIETQRIEQPGPIAYAESTTLTKVFAEDANRCIVVQTDEQSEQTRRILLKHAEAYGVGHDPDNVGAVVQKHYALQRLLPRQGVMISYAQALAERFPVENVEARRAYGHLLRLIASVTLLHFRQRRTDGGRLVATLDDYRVARALLDQPLAEMLGRKVNAAAARLHGRLTRWFSVSDVFDKHDVAKRDALHDDQVRGLLRQLHEAGRLEVAQPSRGRQPTRYRLVPGPPQEAALATLPMPEMLIPYAVAQRSSKT